MNSSAWRKAARSAARSAAEGALGFCVCAALARLLCPRAEFAPAAAGLALAWAAAAAGTAALALG
ncbi:MAG: hypothetical protein KGL04_09705, partial [Elusimicrobia bacterium]|nr:hypothetical protein [Elusimicrobiota bacterium]